MMISYREFYELPNSKAKKLLEISLKVREWKSQTEGLGALAGMLFGKK